MEAKRTAVILIGYQHDYFGKDGILHQVIETDAQKVLTNTLDLLDTLKGTNTLIISTPIIFTPQYDELSEPVGILKAIKDVGAFCEGKKGSETIPEIKKYGDKILEVPGKRGLNAFSNTNLDKILQENNIEDFIISGVVTSICIDSTGRSAHEKGYKVHILGDCTCGRTEIEQNFYLENVFPLYAQVIDRKTLTNQLNVG